MNIDELRRMVLEACNTCDAKQSSPCDMGIGPQAADHKPKQPGKMARTNLITLARDTQELLNMFGDETELDDWIESKITKAADYLAAVKKHIGGEIVRSTGNLMEEKDRMAAIRDAAEVDAYKLAGTATKAMNSAKDQIGEPLINKFFQNDDDKFGFLDKIHGDIQIDLLEEMGLRESKKNKE